MRNKCVKAGLFLLVITLSSPSWAQLVGDDNTPGTSCDKKGAIQMTANATGPGAYILTCDGNAPSGKWVATLNSAQPTANAQVANKQYVDNAVASSGGNGAGIACVYAANQCYYPFVDTGMTNIGGTGSTANQKICCMGPGLVGVAPTTFNFTDQTNVKDWTVIESDLVTIGGIATGSASVSISGNGTPQLSINGGTWAISGTVSNGQTLRIRLTSSASASTTHSALISVGTYSTTWSVTTSATVCPNVGNTCVDGTKYAGTHAGKRLYTTTADQSASAMWKTSTGVDDIATDSDDNGYANSSQVANSTTFPAFKLCKDLGAEWYLPALNELQMVLTNGAAIGGFSNAYYWSSTENNSNTAYLRPFPGGASTNRNKDTTYRVRCVRQ